MTPQNVKARCQIAAIATVIAVIGAALPMGRSLAAEADNQKVGKFAEQIVQVQSKDDIVDSGALFAPPKDVAKPIAVIWIHGGGVNFYAPNYVAISRALAKRGYITITANTRRCMILEMWRPGEGKADPRRWVEEDLELLKSSINRQHTRPSRVNAVMIQGAEHMYAGQEDRVAQVIASWADTLLPANTEKGEVPKTPQARTLIRKWLRVFTMKRPSGVTS